MRLVSAPILALLVFPLPAAANLRAPGHVPHAPSSVLYPPGEGLTVKSENLTFACDDRCTVSALYTVQAQKASKLSFEFILPAKERVTVQVGGARAPVRIAQAEPLSPREERHDLQIRIGRGQGSPRPLYRARFDGELAAGVSQILVTYEQPLGAYERDYGYFSKGRWVQELRYELWPLKEWTLSPTFRLEVKVTIPRRAPGVWKRWFGKVRTVACHGLDQKTSSPLSGATLVQGRDVLELRAQLDARFPDRLRCRIGDEDLVR